MVLVRAADYWMLMFYSEIDTEEDDEDRETSGFTVANKTKKAPGLYNSQISKIN